MDMSIRLPTPISILAAIVNVESAIGREAIKHGEVNVHWHLSYRADKRALPLANAHYNRQNPESLQFVPPGRCIVLLTEPAHALWVTSWPFGEYVKHSWPGAWINSCFRNERPDLYRSSELIREAVAATQAIWDTPDLGIVTFVDPEKVRKKRDFGRCYVRAGFRRIGTTKGGLIAFQMLPEDMPSPELPIDGQAALVGMAVR